MPLNPYTPPTAALADPEELDGNMLARRPKRPKLVWAIALYYGCNVVAAALGTYLVLAHPDVAPSIIRTQFQASGWSQYAVTAAVAILKLLAIICLIRLQPVSMLLLWLLFAYRFIIFFAPHIFPKNSFLHTPSILLPNLIGTVAGLILSLAIALYATRLRSSGVLRN
jgi:hypothetical protein